MPSEIAQTIVNHIFSDEKRKQSTHLKTHLPQLLMTLLKQRKLNLQKSGDSIQMKLDKRMPIKLQTKPLMVKKLPNYHLLLVKLLNKKLMSLSSKIFKTYHQMNNLMYLHHGKLNPLKNNL